jgi:hypothetical protein
LTKKVDEHEVLLGHDEMSEDESEGDLELSGLDPEDIEDNEDLDLENLDLAALALEEDEDE